MKEKNKEVSHEEVHRRDAETQRKDSGGILRGAGIIEPQRTQRKDSEEFYGEAGRDTLAGEKN